MLEMGTVVVAISEPIEASITATLIAKDGKGSRVRQVIASDKRPPRKNAETGGSRPGDLSSRMRESAWA